MSAYVYTSFFGKAKVSEIDEYKKNVSDFFLYGQKKSPLTEGRLCVFVEKVKQAAFPFYALFD